MQKKERQISAPPSPPTSLTLHNTHPNRGGTRYGNQAEKDQACHGSKDADNDKGLS